MLTKKNMYSNTRKLLIQLVNAGISEAQFCYIINKQEIKLQKLKMAVLLALFNLPNRRASIKIIALLAFKARVEQQTIIQNLMASYYICTEKTNRS
jgi:uncharacterized protein Smg (DUF494 family)